MAKDQNLIHQNLIQVGQLSLLKNSSSPFDNQAFLVEAEVAILLGHIECSTHEATPRSLKLKLRWEQNGVFFKLKVRPKNAVREDANGEKAEQGFWCGIRS
ncbi:hypothetical protein [Synechococcus sp. R6-5]|uniref:hypothetical protein n=1 Tax=Synechococcus sp. R6-5 TaxID=2421326 RepID=UPI0039C3509A